MATRKTTAKKAAPKQAKKAAPKKAAAKKAAPKKAAAKPAAKKAAPKKAAAKPAPAPRRKPVITEPLRRLQVVDMISGDTGLSKDQVRKVMDAQEEIVERCLRAKGCGIAQIGTLIKVERYKRPATKKRTGRNLRTGEPIVIPARRARNAVRVKKLKKLTDMV